MKEILNIYDIPIPALIATAHVDGETLRSAIMGKPISKEDARKIAAGIERIVGKRFTVESIAFVIEGEIEGEDVRGDR